MQVKLNAFSSCIILYQSKDNTIYKQPNGTVVKVFHESFPQEKRNKVSSMTRYFLEHENQVDIVPTKVFLSVNGLLGYEMNHEQEYQPVSHIAPFLSIEEKEHLLREVERTLEKNNPAFIYEDIDVDNIFYKDGKIKLIDFDDCVLTNELSEEEYQRSIAHQKYVFHLFSLGLLYDIPLNEIYYIQKSENVSEEDKEQIQTLLGANYQTIDELLTSYHQMNKKK